MNKNNTKKPVKRGRPVEHPMPELIPDTPENVARALVTSPPKGKGKGKWRYLRDQPRAN